MKVAKKKLSDEIPTSSMADIAFLLIVYFMVTMTFTATRGLDFALPEEDDTPPLIEKEDSVLIEIMPGGAILVDQRPMEVSEILDYLRPKLEVNPKKPVIIKPDPASEYGYMVQVLDELRQGPAKGFKEEVRISIPTQREIESFWF
jgi:biopolymer transport protein ExbD